ncbi:MAG: hypothetical protein QW035_01100 [Candidatus Anstonellales archaeon]
MEKARKRYVAFEKGDSEKALALLQEAFGYLGLSELMPKVIASSPKLVIRFNHTKYKQAIGVLVLGGFKPLATSGTLKALKEKGFI